MDDTEFSLRCKREDPYICSYIIMRYEVIHNNWNCYSD